MDNKHQGEYKEFVVIEDEVERLARQILHKFKIELVINHDISDDYSGENDEFWKQNDMPSIGSSSEPRPALRMNGSSQSEFFKNISVESHNNTVS